MSLVPEENVRSEVARNELMRRPLGTTAQPENIPLLVRPRTEPGRSFFAEANLLRAVNKAFLLSWWSPLAKWQSDTRRHSISAPKGMSTGGG